MQYLLRYKRYPYAVIFAVMLIILVPVASFSLTINYTYDNAGRLIKAAYGGGEKILSYQYDAAGNITAYSLIESPQIKVTPSILNFGYVPPGSYKDLILKVENIGAGTLTGTVSATDSFSIVLGGDYSLGAGESRQVIVRYMAPLQGGSQTSSLTFTGGGGITIQLKGTNQNVGLPWLLLLLGN
jgi:YD repeat-containing protein